ncbi:unnamed protein product, partial [Adineta steineri]
MVKDIVIWRIHELAEREFEQGRFRRRRYRQQMRQLQMQPSPYESQPIPSFYPSNSYYMCSPPPSYHGIYSSSPNTPSGNHPMNSIESSPTMTNFHMISSPPTSYSYYDP